MKRLLVSLLILCLATCGFAQDSPQGISYYGDNIIRGDEFRVSSVIDAISLDMSLSVYRDEIINYTLYVTLTSKSPFSVDEGMSLELTTTGGQTIKLTCRFPCNATSPQPIIRNGWIDEAYRESCSYDITPKQIEQLAKGVKRIRIETTADAIEKTYKADMIGQGLNYQYQAIKKELSKPAFRRH